MNQNAYLVTGATGNVGSEVVAQLLAAGKRTRVFTRDAGKAARWGDRVEVAIGDFDRPDSFARAIESVDAVFLMLAGIHREDFTSLTDVPKTAGRPRMVLMSSLIADQPQLTTGRVHKQMEDALRASGLPLKILRPGGFMSNAYQWIGTIEAQGMVYNPLGGTRIPPIAPEDIAEVAVKMLLDPTIEGEIFEMTGGELLTVTEQVEILAKVLGRSIRCVDVPVEAAAQNMVRAGVPPHVAAAAGEAFAAIRKREVIAVKDTVERITGHKPMTFDAWARKHAGRFVKTAAA